MSKILVYLSIILLLAFPVFAEETIVDYSDTSVSILNNELRELNRKFRTTQSIPAGGTTGQVLVKDSATNYDVSWVTVSTLIDGVDDVTLESSGGDIRVKHSFLYSVGDDVTIHDNATERAGNSAVYAKLKESTFNFPYTETVRVYFSIEGGNNESVKGKIYKNGVAYGTEKSGTATNPATYTTFYEDLSFSPGDTIEIWVKGEVSNVIKCKDLQIKGVHTFLTIDSTDGGAATATAGA